MNRALRILLLTEFLALLSIGLLGPLYAVFAEKIGGDILEITGAYALFLISAGILQLFLSKLVDILKEKEFILAAGYFLIAAGQLGYLWVDAPAKLFLIQIILGIALGLLDPSLDFLYSVHLDPGRGGFEWGVYEGLTKIAGGLGAILGGVIVTLAGGFSALFISMAALSFLSGIIILAVPRSWL